MYLVCRLQGFHTITDIYIKTNEIFWKQQQDMGFHLISLINNNPNPNPILFKQCRSNLFCFYCKSLDSTNGLN